MTNQIHLNQTNPIDGDQVHAATGSHQVHRVIIQPAFRKNGRRDCVKAGPRFISLFQNEIICISALPFHDSARVLKARGYKGAMEMWHQGSNHPSTSQSIDDAAGLTIEEGNRSPTLVKYKSLQTAPKARRATPSIAPGLKKALGELTAVQGIESGTAPSPI